MARSPLTRLPAALLAFVWIAAPIASVFHGIAVAHRYCAEHQGFEESDQVTETERGRTDQAGESAQGSGPTEDRQEHEACAFHVAWISDQALSAPDLQPAPLPDGATQIIPVTVTSVIADVLAGAPKTSPPARAA